jgi:dTDP-glucose pyrophosphorylase
MHSDLDVFCVSRHCTAGQAVAQMDKSRLGIVLVVDEDRRLVGTITDGDVRRALLADVDLAQSVDVLLGRKAAQYTKPITAPVTGERTMWLALLKEHRILHIPLLDDDGRVAGLATLDEFVPSSFAPPRAVIMAGGAGTRLRPLTDDTPKPMLPIGDRPLMEIMVEQLKQAGIKRIDVTAHHKLGKIVDHFGDGGAFGVEMGYVTEDQPLGTAGGLGLMAPPTETTLVINGDILTHVDFRAMHAYHHEHRAELTIAVGQYDLQVPYGVVECDGAAVQRLTEKPRMRFFVNAGIYLLEPSVYALIPRGRRCDMTELIEALIAQQRVVVSFPIREYWLDIGQPADYQAAQEHAKTWPERP